MDFILDLLDQSWQPSLSNHIVEIESLLTLRRLLLP